MLVDVVRDSAVIAHSVEWANYLERSVEYYVGVCSHSWYVHR